ncbi:MAG: ABC transporter permease [Candidatus Sumerlaeia bacterium]
MAEPLTTRVGHWTIELLEKSADFAAFSREAVVQLIKPPYRPSLIVYQAVRQGVGSLGIANLSSFFIGMVIVLQTGYQLSKFGAKGYVSGLALAALVREMVPVFVGLVVGARVAANIAAELGTMRVTEQISALQALAVDPVNYLVAPRIVACLLSLPVLSLYCLVTGYLGGMLVGGVVLGIGPAQYFYSSMDFIVFNDVWQALLKTAVFGVVIAISGCYSGFRARGGAEGVGRATNEAIVYCMTFVLLFDYIINQWFLVLVEGL